MLDFHLSRLESGQVIPGRFNLSQNNSFILTYSILKSIMTSLVPFFRSSSSSNYRSHNMRWLLISLLNRSNLLSLISLNRFNRILGLLVLNWKFLSTFNLISFMDKIASSYRNFLGFESRVLRESSFCPRHFILRFLSRWELRNAL